MSRIFVTGSAGFIGFHLSRRLLADGHEVLGYDAFTPYYDPGLKRARVAILEARPGFRQVEGMLEDADTLRAALDGFTPDIVVHLGAQAGIRDGLSRPRAYVDSNYVGTFNLLDAVKQAKIGHFLLASTSSVYGANTGVPFRERDATLWPVSLYAATKRACEALSHSYAHIYGLPVTCFRFFTVYGPWGRPDMAYFKFTRAIGAGEPIEVYGNGEMRRDFTYIDDLIEAIVRLAGEVPVAGKAGSAADSISPVAPWRVVNIGGGTPVGLMELIETIEAALGRAAIKQMKPMVPGDMVETFASPELLEALVGYRPETGLKEGIGRFVEWYRGWNRGPST